MLPKVTGSQICEKHLMERTHPHRNHSQSSPLLWALALVRYWHSIPSIPHVMCTVVNGYEIAFCSNRTPLCAGLPHTEPNFTLKVHLILSPATQYPVSAGVRCSWPRANQRDIVASPWSLCKVNIWKPWSRQSLGLPQLLTQSIFLYVRFQVYPIPIQALPLSGQKQSLGLPLTTAYSIHLRINPANSDSLENLHLGGWSWLLMLHKRESRILIA